MKLTGLFYRLKASCRQRARVFALALTLAVCPGISRGQIFADFTTSMGSFSCQLDQTNAPRAVANFIGLATGQRPWLDEVTGRARTNAFYNSLTFHRVIAGFMIQGGSPNGLGTDGPGYALRDEITPALRFDSFGVLAMANSGTNSNGAQFFVTVAPTTWLNDGYTIFGRLASGSNVVYAISQVAIDANDKPLTNVVIQQVAIRRVGAAAQSFDISAQGLPVVTNLPLRIGRAGSQVTLTYSNQPYAHNQIFSSTNLANWTSADLGIEITAPATNSVSEPVDQPRNFFRLAQVRYPDSTLAPKSLYGQKLVITFTSGASGVLTVTFDSAGAGTYTYSTSPGTLTGYYYGQEPYRGSLLIGFSGLYPMKFMLNFNNATSGACPGTVYPYYPATTGSFAVGGTFTLGPP